MKKQTVLRVLAALLLIGSLLSVVSCASNEESDIPEGMQSATAQGATYRLYVPTTWSLKILPGISGAYYNISEQSAVSVAEYPIDEALAATLAALDENTSPLDYYFETTLFAQTKLMATGEVQRHAEDCIATTLGGANARQYHTSATVAGTLTHFLHVIATKDNRFYVFSFTATEELYTFCMDDVKKMLEKFKFDVAYAPTETAKNFPANVTVPAGMQIASDADAEYYFFVPTSWAVHQASTACAATAPDGSFVSVVSYLPTTAISVEEYFAESERMMQTTSGGQYTRISEAKIDIGGGKGLQYEYDYTVGGVTYRYLQIIVGYKSTIYNLTYTALPQNFDTNRADVDAIIAAFTFR